LDETFDLGRGQSKEECEKKGTQVVYLEFLRKIYDLLKQEHPSIVMQFWGDIVIHRPDMIHLLPKDIIALEWGYEGNHPFSTHSKIFAGAGIPFYVCPGTSSWNTLGGRVKNCYENLQNAAENGYENGALGYLVTDWGDHGHWQQLPVSFFGFMAGAEFCWNSKAHRNENLEQGWSRIGDLLDTYTFRDKSKLTGKFILDLGNAYLHTNSLIGNQSAICKLVLFYGEYPVFKGDQRPTPERLQQTELVLQTAKSRYSGKSEIGRDDKDAILEELDWTCDMMIFACRFGVAYAQSVWAQGTENISVKAALPGETKQRLIAELNPLLHRFEKCWLIRNRQGGLKDSIGRLYNLRDLLL